MVTAEPPAGGTPCAGSVTISIIGEGYRWVVDIPPTPISRHPR